MSKARLEAFSDGVMAIIITIMVLELKAPNSAELSAMRGVLPAPGQLRAEFRLRRNLLEQSSSHLPRRRARQRHDPVGQSALVVLAVADPVRHPVDGREPVRHLAGRRVWGRL